jgi:hypothetical protein
VKNSRLKELHIAGWRAETVKLEGSGWST